jgi:hypothetical protein
MFGSMPFRYGKVSNESSTDDESQTHPGPGRVTFWSRICDTTRKLRWPCTFFLLLVSLAVQVQILHRQPIAMPVGSEMNGIVPHCTAILHSNLSLHTNSQQSAHRKRNS